jgi:hypothetical protein
MLKGVPGKPFNYKGVNQVGLVSPLLFVLAIFFLRIILKTKTTIYDFKFKLLY